MTELMKEQRLDQFLDALASKSPTPGGGSVAGLSGAMAAGLLSMVCALTLGKKQPADLEADVQAVHQQAEALRADLQQLMQADIEVFKRLSAAYKLPRVTDADAATRRAAIQKLTQVAAEVPLKTAQKTAALLPLCDSLVERCGQLVVSDVGVAALLAQATVQSALLNVEINLASLEDKRFVYETQAALKDLTLGLEAKTLKVLAAVRKRINS